MMAYEMRIRDWSSDVCSSDLRSHAMKKFLLALSAAVVMSGAALVPTAPAMARSDHHYDRGDHYRGHNYRSDRHYRGDRYYRGDRHYRGGYYRSADLRY